LNENGKLGFKACRMQNARKTLGYLESRDISPFNEWFSS